SQPPNLPPFGDVLPPLEPGFPIPEWVLTCTNRVRYVLMDGDRIVDFANLDCLGWEVDLVQTILKQDAVSGQASITGNMWRMGRVLGSDDVSIMTEGIELQLAVAAGLIEVGRAVWNDYALSREDKDKAIEAFRSFLGFPPLHPGGPIRNSGLVAVAPFVAARKVEIIRRYEVSDPFVHYTPEDVRRTVQPWQYAVPPKSLVGFEVGKSNENYGGWAGSPYKNTGRDGRAFNEQVTDPGVYSSNDWAFGSGLKLNHRFFDHVHRGTPWQTIYYHGENVDPYLWERYRGAAESSPERDWVWIEEFRKDWLGLPVVESATPEPVLVNNTIANNAALPGERGTAIHLEPQTSTQIANNIVAFNSAGIEQVPGGSPTLLSNAVHGNTNGNYIGLSPG
ncbi:MAG: hypothetical protein HQ505_09325, partial [Nitrosopumilus sp.]|nr:hypothetical protein [Nitrosopumilus sp.]